MNYFEIGQRVRRYRRAKGLSQEELAEKVGISSTHMSHIETGNTKLSLSVLVLLAAALEVRTDDLLFDNPHADCTAASEEILSHLEDCSARELKILKDILIAAKAALRRYTG